MRLLLLILFSLLSNSASAIDWSKIEGTQLTLFFPGQYSWEWLLTSHQGANSIKKGRGCFLCHKGQEKKKGEAILKHDHHHNAMNSSSLDVIVKAAYDKDDLHINISHDAHQSVTNYTLMLDDGSVRASTVAGCWAYCHEDQSEMKAAGTGERSHYLSQSRSELTTQGGGDSLVSSQTLEKLVSEKQFNEIWQARLSTGNKAVTTSGYILEKRHLVDNNSVKAQTRHHHGQNAIVFSRKLKSARKFQKDLNSENLIYLGLAVHRKGNSGRTHLVSFPFTLSLNKNISADVNAKAL
ncbi:MAG: hypothetical protein OEX00_09525 [Gammaproteobacteria bacterium]|nr:hypothetical protein [Gammaproteobacteria bacterium]MDH5692882.1 hypothetical protein [Gammaproteobacteria bacterium]